VEPGKFGPDRYIALATTAYDISDRIFTCHKSSEDEPIVCAGFLERGADHNLSIRLSYIKGDLTFEDRSGGCELREDYRAVAIANGVDPDHPALKPCR
jgi:hypothetical protein